MERSLLIAGRILAGLLVVVAAILLVALLVGRTFVNAISTVPSAVAQTLADENFYALTAQTVLMNVLDGLPDVITGERISISKTALTEALNKVGMISVAREVVPREAILARFVSGFAGARTPEASETGLIQGALRGDEGGEVARLVVSAAAACSDSQIARLLSLQRNPSPTAAAITFICNPPAIDVNALMQQLVKAALIGVANRLVDVQPFAGIDPSDIAIETPIGTISLNWPAVHLTVGRIDFVYTLPESITEPVDAAVAQLRSTMDTLRDRIETLAAATPDVSSIFIPRQEATEQVTPEAAVIPPLVEQSTEQVTPEAAVNQPLEGLATEEAPSSEAGGRLAGLAETRARISESVNTTLTALNQQLNELTDSINRALILVLGALFLLVLVEVLFLVRTWRALGIWLGAVLLASGILILIVYQRLTSNPITFYPPAELSESALQLRATLAGAVSTALHDSLGNPLLIQGIIVGVIGAALLAYILLIVRRRAGAASATAN